jgi:hypothetical protein
MCLKDCIMNHFTWSLRRAEHHRNHPQAAIILK